MTLRVTLSTTLMLLCTGLAQHTPQELAQALQTAARAGDTAAYRKLLAPNGTFTIEGAHFAADLRLHPPKDVTYTLSNVQQQGSMATANLTLRWTRPAEDGSQAEGASRVTLPVQLVRSGEVWRYAGEALTPLKTEMGTLLVLRTLDLAQRVTPFAQLTTRASQELKTVLGMTVPKDVVIKVYPDFSSLSASVSLSLPPVNGWHEPGEAIKFVMPGGSTAEMKRATLQVLTHEFTHLALSQESQSPNKPIPWWLHEGMANYAARSFLNKQRLQEWRSRAKTYASFGWVPLSKLVDFRVVPEYRWDNSYSQGLGMVEFLAEQRGKAQPKRLAVAFAKTGNADAAARSVGFASFEALETAAKAWLTGR